MSKKRNQSLHFYRNKRYFCSIGLFDFREDWVKPCSLCAHYRYADGSELYGDYSPAWCAKKDMPVYAIETSKRPKCFRRKVSR